MDAIFYCDVQIKTSLTDKEHLNFENPIPVQVNPLTADSTELITHIFHQLLIDFTSPKDFEIYDPLKEMAAHKGKPRYIVFIEPKSFSSFSIEVAKKVRDWAADYSSESPLLPLRSQSENLSLTATYQLVCKGASASISSDIFPFYRKRSPTPTNISEIKKTLFTSISDDKKLPSQFRVYSFRPIESGVYQMTVSPRTQKSKQRDVTKTLKTHIINYNH